MEDLVKATLLAAAYQIIVGPKANTLIAEEDFSSGSEMRNKVSWVYTAMREDLDNLTDPSTTPNMKVDILSQPGL